MMVDDPVKRVDNMAMAWGLETRVPFLDHEVVELAAPHPGRKHESPTSSVLNTFSRKTRAARSRSRSSGKPKAISRCRRSKYLRGPFFDFVRGVLDAPGTARQRRAVQPSVYRAADANPEGELDAEGTLRSCAQVAIVGSAGSRPKDLKAQPKNGITAMEFEFRPIRMAVSVVRSLKCRPERAIMLCGQRPVPVRHRGRNTSCPDAPHPAGARGNAALAVSTRRFRRRGPALGREFLQAQIQLATEPHPQYRRRKFRAPAARGKTRPPRPPSTASPSGPQAVTFRLSSWRDSVHARPGALRRRHGHWC